MLVLGQLNMKLISYKLFMPEVRDEYDEINE